MSSRFICVFAVAADYKVCVGNLCISAAKADLEQAFGLDWLVTDLALPLWSLPFRGTPNIQFGHTTESEVLCGTRVHVEMSTGMSRRPRFGGRTPARRPFDPNDRCYECGQRGHYAYDCYIYSRRKRHRLVHKLRKHVGFDPFSIDSLISLYLFV
uniref:CCHC-type domain-containing protein n=1 Tax=Eptatretus burgeri TaxID=7764 RepID=A0A8C4WYB6_EPTBU